LKHYIINTHIAYVQNFEPGVNVAVRLWCMETVK